MVGPKLSNLCLLQVDCGLVGCRAPVGHLGPTASSQPRLSDQIVILWKNTSDRSPPFEFRQFQQPPVSELVLNS